MVVDLTSPASSAVVLTAPLPGVRLQYRDAQSVAARNGLVVFAVRDMGPPGVWQGGKTGPMKLTNATITGLYSLYIYLW